MGLIDENIIVQDLQYRYDNQKDFFILVSFIDFKFKLVFFLEDDLLKEEVYLNVIVKLIEYENKIGI